MFQLELLNSLFIWGDGGALDGNLAFLGGLSGVDGDLIVGGISVLNRQVIVLDVQVEIWVDMLKYKNKLNGQSVS